MSQSDPMRLYNLIGSDCKICSQEGESWTYSPPGGWELDARSGEAARRMGLACTQRRSHQEDGTCTYAAAKPPGGWDLHVRSGEAARRMGAAYMSLLLG